MDKILMFIVMSGMGTVLVNGFRCYECEFCQEPFYPDTTSTNVTVAACEGTCATSVVQFDGMETVDRFCFESSNISLACETVDLDEHYRATTCYCRLDLCNHGNHRLPGMLVLFAALSLVYQIM